MRAPVTTSLAVAAGFFALVAATSTGCSSQPFDESEGTGAAVVSSEEFTRASNVVDRIDYLPFEYTTDGCYARAYYVSMELAAERIESNAVFAIARRGGPRPSFNRTTWDYHTAPVIEVSAGEGPPAKMVVDRAVADRPLTLEGWLSAIHVTERNVDVVLMPGAVLQQRKAVDLTKRGGSLTQRLTESFEDMPSFDLAEVQVACQTVHRILYLDARNVDASGATLPGTKRVGRAAAIAAAAPKREKLLERTATLVGLLAANGKLRGSGSFSPTACAAGRDD